MKDSLTKQLGTWGAVLEEQRSPVDVVSLQREESEITRQTTASGPAAGSWPELDTDAEDGSGSALLGLLGRPRVLAGLMSAMAVVTAVALAVILNSSDTASPERAEPATNGAASPTGSARIVPATQVPASLTWVRIPHDEAVFGGPGDQEVSAVVAGGPGLVAVGLDGFNFSPAPPDVKLADAAAWASVDGVRWSRASIVDDESLFGKDAAHVMQDVTTGGPGLVAVGYEWAVRRTGFHQFSVAAVWASPDGRSWTRAPHDDVAFGGDGGSETMRAVVAGGPGLVAVGWADTAAAIWTSTDGLAWSRILDGGALFDGLGGHTSIEDVAVGGPGLVAVGQTDGAFGMQSWTGHGSAVVWTSTDGLNWSRVAHDEAVFGGPGDQWMLDVTPVGSGLAVVGFEGGPELDDQDGRVVWTSTDGLTWSRAPQSELAVDGEGNRWIGRLTDEPGLVVIGEEIWTSEGGETWSLSSDLDSVIVENEDSARSIALGGPGLVAIGASGFSSTEGHGPTDADVAVWTAVLGD